MIPIFILFVQVTNIVVQSSFGGLGVACCLEVPKFAGSNPAEADRIFQGEKILSTPSFRGEVKPSVPCCRFAACKRSLNVTCKLAFWQNYQPTFSLTVPAFAARISRVIWMWRHLVVEVGMSKLGGVPGSHNKPIGCGASGACAPGPDDEDEEEHTIIVRLCINLLTCEGEGVGSLIV
jgi:hypothetical protein